MHKRLQEVKKSFNVSRVCQEAIETEVKRHELLKSGLEDMKDVIERLRLEKVEFLKESYDIGYKEGLDYFREIPYGVLTIIDQYRDGPQQAAWECCEKFDLDFLCGGIFGEGITSIFEAEALKEKFGRPDIDDDLYAKGFFKALVDCYDKIKDQL